MDAHAVLEGPGVGGRARADAADGPVCQSSNGPARTVEVHHRTGGRAHPHITGARSAEGMNVVTLRQRVHPAPVVGGTKATREQLAAVGASIRAAIVAPTARRLAT